MDCNTQRIPNFAGDRLPIVRRDSLAVDPNQAQLSNPAEFPATASGVHGSTHFLVFLKMKERGRKLKVQCSCSLVDVWMHAIPLSLRIWKTILEPIISPETAFSHYWYYWVSHTPIEPILLWAQSCFVPSQSMKNWAHALCVHAALVLIERSPIKVVQPLCVLTLWQQNQKRGSLKGSLFENKEKTLATCDLWLSKNTHTHTWCWLGPCTGTRCHEGSRHVSHHGSWAAVQTLGSRS